MKPSSMDKFSKQSWVVLISTYPPRECGIATFTKDLTTAMNARFNPKIKSKIIAMEHETLKYKYSDDVISNINEEHISDYVNTAKRINEMDNVRLVNIQHEFNLFGGYYGEYLLEFIENTHKPIVVTFHTVVPHRIHKNDTRKRVVQAIAKKAKKIVVLTNLAVSILKGDYEINDSKIVVIPHGIHEVPYEPSIIQKTELGYKNKIVFTTFGFIRESKGNEYVIDALPKVIEKFPNVLYLIIGEVHPRHRSKGERYLNFLKNRVKELGLQKNVTFINKYVTLHELIKYLKATDLYLCSTISKGQIVSGTLSYAMGCGRAIVSAPFLHAEEAVTRERGRVVNDFKNPTLFSDAIIEILSNPTLKENMEKNAYGYTRRMTWPNVAKAYMKVFHKFFN